jgi:hypothetical protein
MTEENTEHYKELKKLYDEVCDKINDFVHNSLETISLSTDVMTMLSQIIEGCLTNFYEEEDFEPVCEVFHKQLIQFHKLRKQSKND